MFCLFRWCYKLIGCKVDTYRLPDGGVCAGPGVLPPVTEIPSSRRVVRVCFPCTRSAYPVVDVLPSRQQGAVRLSGGFTPGYGDTVFQSGGASVLSVLAFAFMIIEVLPSRQQGVVRASGGSTPGY